MPVAVVVARAVEQWHSAQASWVWIPGRTWLFFFRLRIAVKLFSLGVKLFLKRTINRMVHIFLFLSFYLIWLPNISIPIQKTIKQEKGKINPKRGRARPLLKNVSSFATVCIDCSYNLMRINKAWEPPSLPEVSCIRPLGRVLRIGLDWTEWMNYSIGLFGHLQLLPKIEKLLVSCDLDLQLQQHRCTLETKLDR